MKKDIFDEFEEFLKSKEIKEDKFDDFWLLAILTMTLFHSKQEPPVINIFLGDETNV